MESLILKTVAALNATILLAIIEALRNLPIVIAFIMLSALFMAALVGVGMLIMKAVNYNQNRFFDIWMLLLGLIVLLGLLFGK